MSEHDEVDYRLEMRIRYRDGTRRAVTIPPVTQVAWERHFGAGLMDYLASFGVRGHIERWYWLAWQVDGQGAEFDAWLLSVDGVGVPDPSLVETTAPPDED